MCVQVSRSPEKTCVRAALGTPDWGGRSHPRRWLRNVNVCKVRGLTLGTGLAKRAHRRKRGPCSSQQPPYDVADSVRPVPAHRMRGPGRHGRRLQGHPPRPERLRPRPWWSRRCCRRSPRSASSSTMFSAEARLMAQLSHPNVVQVHDFGVVDGIPYLAMEYLPGRNLSQLRAAVAARGQRVPVGCALAIARDMCHGLGYAHEFVDSDGKRTPDHPSRRVAVERDGVPRRHGQAARLRRRQDRRRVRLRPHAVVQGQVRVHGAGAGEPSADRSARRRVRRRHRAARAAHRQAPVRGADRARDAAARVGGAGDRAVGGQPRGAARARRHREEGAGARSERALRVGRGAGRGARVARRAGVAAASGWRRSWPSCSPTTGWSCAKSAASRCCRAPSAASAAPRRPRPRRRWRSIPAPRRTRCRRGRRSGRSSITPIATRSAATPRRCRRCRRAAPSRCRCRRRRSSRARRRSRGCRS